VQVKGDRVLRVLPLENEGQRVLALGPGPISRTKDLNAPDRLRAPMVGTDDDWVETDWQTALTFVRTACATIVAEHGAEAVAAAVSPHSTLEEMALARAVRARARVRQHRLRLRQTTSALDGKQRVRLGSACRSPR
jgi:NADH-quinone oxidoreductase subunit G